MSEVRASATDELDGKDVCRWGQFGDDMEMDVSTDCGHAMFEYEGDEMHWLLDDGDECPYCGRPIMRVWGWLI